jgi:chromosomal replication initiation ATPase DnaA
MKPTRYRRKAKKSRTYKRNELKTELLDIYLDSIGKEFKVDKSDVLGRCRKRIHCYSRHILVYFLYNHASIGSTHIGKIINRNHKTIFHSLNLCKIILDEKYNYPYRDEFLNLLDTFGNLKKPQIKRQKKCRKNDTDRIGIL